MILVPQTAAATWRVRCALVNLLFPLVSWFLVLLCAEVVVFFFFQVSATSPAGGHDIFFPSYILQYIFSLSICLFFCFSFVFF